MQPYQQRAKPSHRHSGKQPFQHTLLYLVQKEISQLVISINNAALRLFWLKIPQHFTAARMSGIFKPLQKATLTVQQTNSKPPSCKVYKEHFKDNSNHRSTCNSCPVPQQYVAITE